MNDDAPDTQLYVRQRPEPMLIENPQDIRTGPTGSYMLRVYVKRWLRQTENLRKILSAARSTTATEGLRINFALFDFPAVTDNASLPSIVDEVATVSLFVAIWNYIRAKRQLRILDVFFVAMPCPYLHRTLQYATGNTSLQEINLANCIISIPTFVHLFGNHPSLKRLGLQGVSLESSEGELELTVEQLQLLSDAVASNTTIESLTLVLTPEVVRYGHVILESLDRDGTGISNLKELSVNSHVPRSRLLVPSIGNLLGRKIPLEHLKLCLRDNFGQTIWSTF